MKKQSQYSVKYGIIIDVVKEFFMNSKVLQVLEYNKIIGMLEEKASSPLGKALAVSLKPGFAHSSFALIFIFLLSFFFLDKIRGLFLLIPTKNFLFSFGKFHAVFLRPSF